MKHTISIMIPAYNEEKYIKRTVDGVDKIVKGMFKDYEILIFDDCSSDKTGEIADGLAKKNSRIKVIHNKKNMGLGYNYKKGIEIAKKEYYMWVPGDNDVYATSLKKIMSNVGKSDIVMAYTVNKESRSWDRRIISEVFTNMLNFLFGLHVKYYNGPSIFKTGLARKIRMRTNSYAQQAEILIQLLKKGYSYTEVPEITRGTKDSKLFRIKNIIGVFVTIVRLFIEIHFTRRNEFKGA